ncbi:site-2 protease family protein [Zavarzinella formosa]|uniref:site-2 protease family protein n=1 Tax=Zavarzinella formosa TaxID=360055 RepID=UPI0002F6702E|nr:site-2 protease family protein [Zavarzinella formosa]
MDPTFIPTAERRKQVRLRTRMDLVITPQKYEGKWCQVVKDPVSLKYYRFNQHEYFVFQRLSGNMTLDDIRKDFEKNFAPDRLTLEDLEGFARQLVTAGLVQHESPNSSKQLFEKRGKQRRMKRLATVTNILYIKVPVFDPDRILTHLLKYTNWIFTKTFLWFSFGLMLFAALFVAFHYKTFYAKLPAYQEFFAFRTMLYMWLALGVVKIIHEFGHGLSCKAFGGESHEMGFLFMCFSPAMYCNVTDSWTVADKWKRITISFAGIWVELIIASLATFVWWYTPYWPFVNNVAMCLMVLCSISTFMFNANPLMRFDGYYILADWMEVPNLRERANRYLTGILQETCLGVEVPPEPYMAGGRKLAFLAYAIASFVYRWVVTVSILLFLANWLKPYKLETLSTLLALGSLVSMLFWPMFRGVKNIRQRGRLPDMKRKRLMISMGVLCALIFAFFFVPLPVSRVRETGVVQVAEGQREFVHVHESGILEEVYVHEGQRVNLGADLGKFRNPKHEFDKEQMQAEKKAAAAQVHSILGRLSMAQDSASRTRLERDLTEARAALNKAQGMLDKQEQLIAGNEILKASRSGVVMNIPKKEDIFKNWEKGKSPPFCTIGEPSQLRVLIPVNATDFRELRQNLERVQREHPEAPWLEVTILPKNRRDYRLNGRIVRLPDTDEKNVPIALTHRGGGNLATKPSQDQNVHQPLLQTYLIPVEMVDPDDTIAPGTMAQCKVHLQWRSAAWWTWRSIAASLDIGLW